MTEQDIDNSRTGAKVGTIDCAVRVDGVDSQWLEVHINAGIDESVWDQALASASDALVLVQWLESKRT